MYLQALGKYLDHKQEMGELDGVYGYGRDVLLHFARWMALHERPYLERPEQLEFPTETWAAQDMRKSEVFSDAVRHAAADDERARFRERAEFFYTYSISTLTAMPTRMLARPLVVLLSHGFRRAYVEEHPDERAPAPAQAWTDPPLPATFVPQKARVKRRLIAAASVCAVAALVILAWMIATVAR